MSTLLRVEDVGKRFRGLVAVDRATQMRTVKPSGQWLGRIGLAHGGQVGMAVRRVQQPGPVDSFRFQTPQCRPEIRCYFQSPDMVCGLLKAPGIEP